MRARTWATIGIALLLAGAALGCSGGGDDEASFDETGAAVQGGGDGGGERAAAPEEGGDGAGAGLGIPAGDPIQAGRSIIATAEVSLEVEDVGAAARRADDAAAAAGGFLAHQEADPSDGVTLLTLRVPTEHFADVMGRLVALGEVRSQRLDTEDVTEQVVDLESRIASAQRSVARVRALLEESGDVAQLATVEGELARREADLETLLGRQRVLDDQVAMATIHVDLREPAAVEEDDDALPGFLGGLGDGWDAFLTSASVVATALGYALPFVVLAAAVFGGWLWLRRLRHDVPPTALD
jgi:hypothetical protein